MAAIDLGDFEGFEGFDEPTYTQVPDSFFDIVAPQLTEAELKVMLFIIRRTFGFKKQTDSISLSQMVEGMTSRDGRRINRGAGVSRSSAIRAVRGLVQRRLVEARHSSSTEKGYEPTTYTLRFRTPSSTVILGGCQNDTSPGSMVIPALVSPRYLQETIKQENSNSLSSVESTPAHNETTHTASSRERRRRQPSKATPFIEALITQFSAEFHDEEHTTSNVTRTMRLLKASGLPESDFGTYLYQARGMVKSRGNIEKVAAGHAPLKNRMPYFFSVVEDLLGMRDGQDATKSTTHGSLQKDTEKLPSNGTADDQRVTYERFVQS